MRTNSKVFGIFFLGRGPFNRIYNDLLNDFVVEGGEGFVAGLEVEYSAKSANKAAARSEYVSVLKP